MINQNVQSTFWLNKAFLIATEGTQTEPNYFNALKRALDESNRFIIKVTVEGKGKSTKKLVEKVHHQITYNNQEYDRVWAVFDRDSFRDFDSAIQLAKNYGIKCAWSNESFELWLLLHFKDVTVRTERKKLIELLEAAIRDKLRKKNPEAQYDYSKGDGKIYNYVTELGSEDDATRRSLELKKKFEREWISPSRQNPCTHVDELVSELRHPERIKLPI